MNYNRDQDGEPIAERVNYGFSGFANTVYDEEVVSNVLDKIEELMKSIGITGEAYEL